MSGRGRTGGSSVKVTPEGIHLSDGSLLKVVQTLAASGVPLVRPSAGSVAANGAVTFNSAFASVFSGFVVYPANALFAGSPLSMYWTVLSSTTAGVAFNNTYMTGEPAVPEVLVPIVAPAPGAFTFGNGGDSTLFSVVVPADSMGPRGRLTAHFQISKRGADDNESVSVFFGGQYYANIGDPGTVSGEMRITVVNRGVTNRQVGSASNVYTTSNFNSQPAGVSAVDTTAAQIFELRMNSSAPTSWFLIDSMLVEVLPNG